MLDTLLRASREYYAERCDATSKGRIRRREAESAAETLATQVRRLTHEFVSNENTEIGLENSNTVKYLNATGRERLLNYWCAIFGQENLPA